jgi:hypothetical protein
MWLLAFCDPIFRQAHVLAIDIHSHPGPCTWDCSWAYKWKKKNWFQTPTNWDISPMTIVGVFWGVFSEGFSTLKLTRRVAIFPTNQWMSTQLAKEVRTSSVPFVVGISLVINPPKVGISPLYTPFLTIYSLSSTELHVYNSYTRASRFSSRPKRHLRWLGKSWYFVFCLEPGSHGHPKDPGWSILGFPDKVINDKSFGDSIKKCRLNGD